MRGEVQNFDKIRLNLFLKSRLHFSSPPSFKIDLKIIKINSSDYIVSKLANATLKNQEVRDLQVYLTLKNKNLVFSTIC